MKQMKAKQNIYYIDTESLNILLLYSTNNNNELLSDTVIDVI